MNAKLIASTSLFAKYTCSKIKITYFKFTYWKIFRFARHFTKAARLNQIPRASINFYSRRCTRDNVYFLSRNFRYTYVYMYLSFWDSLLYICTCINLFISTTSCDRVSVTTVLRRDWYLLGKICNFEKSCLFFEPISCIVDTAFILIIRPKGLRKSWHVSNILRDK